LSTGGFDTTAGGLLNHRQVSIRPRAAYSTTGREG
jgi:hypothetical protein